MPQTAKPPRLHLRTETNRDGKFQVWVILDTGPDGKRKYVRTGCAKDQTAAAEQKLAEHIAKKWEPPKTGRASEIALADVLMLYLQDVVPKSANPKDASYCIQRLNEFWGTLKITEVVTKSCDDYAMMRGTNSGARKDLEILRAAVRHYTRDRVVDYTPTFTMPDKSQPREKYLTRSEAAALLWAALGWKRNAAGKWEREHSQQYRGLHRASSRGRLYYYAWKNGPRLDGEPGSAEFTAAFNAARALPEAPTRLPVANGERRRHLTRLLIIGLYTGTRPGAILKLQKSENKQGGYADLKNGVIYRRAKGEKVSHQKVKPAVKMSPRLLVHMKRWAQLDRGIRWWVHYQGRPVTKLNKAFRSCVRAAGMDPEEIVPHTLRHTRATWLSQSGTVPATEAAQSLGMTQEMYDRTYSHVDPNYQKNAANAF